MGRPLVCLAVAIVSVFASVRDHSPQQCRVLADDGLDAVRASSQPQYLFVTASAGKKHALETHFDVGFGMKDLVGRQWRVVCSSHPAACGSLEKEIGPTTPSFAGSLPDLPVLVAWDGTKFLPYDGFRNLDDFIEWVHAVEGGPGTGRDAPNKGKVTPGDSEITTPLMTHKERDVLLGWLKDAPDTAQFVEYGAGGSTVLLCEALRGSQTLHSVEHVQEWYEQIRRELEVEHCLCDAREGEDAGEDCAGKVALHFVEPQKDVGVSVPESKFRPHSSPREEVPLGLEAYIHASTTSVVWKDVAGVFVDGIARGAVLAVLPMYLRPGTPVMLHDYNHRGIWYDWALHGYDIVEQVDSALLLTVKKLDNTAP